MRPAAPGMFSTTTAGVPGRCRWRYGAKTRAYRSYPPPALKPTTMRTDRTRKLEDDGPGGVQAAIARSAAHAAPRASTEIGRLRAAAFRKVDRPSPRPRLLNPGPAPLKRGCDCNRHADSGALRSGAALGDARSASGAP